MNSDPQRVDPERIRAEEWEWSRRHELSLPKTVRWFPCFIKYPLESRGREVFLTESRVHASAVSYQTEKKLERQKGHLMMVTRSSPLASSKFSSHFTHFPKYITFEIIN